MTSSPGRVVVVVEWCVYTNDISVSLTSLTMAYAGHRGWWLVGCTLDTKIEVGVGN